MTEMPMFPLGTVLFPTAVLPLHVFEPRYRALVQCCLDEPVPEFGVVLIERGSEVGGEDVRTSVGTVARVLDSHQFDDGRWVIAAVGVRRIRVLRWLDDDPFPIADVEDWPEAEPLVPLAEPYAAVGRLLRRALALKAELGEGAAPATVALTEDPVVGSYQAAALAPLGSLDQQRLLGEAGATERLAALAGLLEEEADFLAQRLAAG